ncbi:hypothetical protein BsWGS_03654 [Bradybaena similaris]
MEDIVMQNNISVDHSYSVLSGSTCPNGKTAKGWENFDQIISRFLVEQKIPGASVAVSKKGIILYQQGYGIAGAGCRVNQDSMFRIASISKPITASIIVQLFDKLKIPLNRKVFGKTGILKSYKTRDKRMKNITVRHLLQHSAGWDRDKVGDAVFVRPKCVVKEHPNSQDLNSALLAYALRRKLQFSPGTWHSYSNLGYLVLGEIIETLTCQPYARVLQTFLQDLDIRGVIVGKRERAHYKCREVEYFNNREPQVVNSIYPEEGMVLPQYGGMAMESSASYGGLVSDTVSLMRFINCMEEAINQSYNDDDCKMKPNSTIEVPLNTKIDAEQLGPDFEETQDLHCQSTLKLKMNINDTKNLQGRMRANRSNCDDDVHGNEAGIRVSSSIFQTSSETDVNYRHSVCVSKSDTNHVLHDVEEPAYKQVFSPRQEVYNLEHCLIMNTSDLDLNKPNTDCVMNIYQSDMLVGPSVTVKPHMKMQYQCDTCLHQNVCLCYRQCVSSDVTSQSGQKYISGSWQQNSNGTCLPSQQFDLSGRQCRQNFDSSDMQCNSGDIGCQLRQLYDSNVRQCTSSGICEPNQQFDLSDSQCSQNFDSSDMQCNFSDIGCQLYQLYDSNVRQCNSTGICEPSQQFDSSERQCNSIDINCQLSQNLESSCMPYNSSTVNCQPGQGFNSSDRQYKSTPDICSCSQASGICADNKCDSCSLKLTVREYSIPESNSNGHLNNFKPTHLFSCTSNRLSMSKPLMTNWQATDSLSRPAYENGRDWYGLGWDVQDHGRSWGHTGGMDGSCGTLFHHHSGLNWTLLLNSWAVDADLNGVVKCALCSVSDVRMYDQDILSVDSESGVRIVTKDKSQIIYLCVSESTLSKVISHVKTDGFFITWVSTVSQDFSYIAAKLSPREKINKPQQNFNQLRKSEPQNRYIAVFKKYHIMDYFVVFNKNATELQKVINECKKDNFVINFLDSFVDSEAELRYTAVFKYNNSRCHDGDFIVLLAMIASDYVKHVKSFLHSHYVVVQSVTEACAELYVSAILVTKSSHDQITWLSHITEHNIKSCVNTSIESTNSCVNRLVKATNLLLSNNAESSAVCSNMIIGSSTVLETQHSNENNGCSSTLAENTGFQDYGGETVFRGSREETTFHESRGETILQGSRGETILQESRGETVFRESKEEAIFKKSSGETVFWESERNVNQELEKSYNNETVLTGTPNELYARSRTINKPKCQSTTRNKSKCQTSSSSSSSSNSAYWVQISPESFLTELNRQTKRNNSLVYAHFYNSDRKPYVSGSWYPQGGGNCYQRISMSRYGLVPELVEAAAENVHLQCLSEYVEEDGVVYYAAIWHAS